MLKYVHLNTISLSGVVLKKVFLPQYKTIKEKLQYNIKIITRTLPGILKTAIQCVQRTKANLMVTDLVHSVANCRLF